MYGECASSVTTPRIITSPWGTPHIRPALPTVR
jgi:hypothetical protein